MAGAADEVLMAEIGEYKVAYKPVLWSYQLSPKVIKFFMLNSTEHEISTTHKN